MSVHNNQRIGSYRILRPLGEGGMGAVFEAEHVSLARRVAIKVVHPAYASDPEALARFFNEAKAVNLIDHPGLVQILDYGHQDDGCAYLVMELLKGETLRSRLLPKRSGLPVPEVLHIGRQLAAALAAAHGCGIVHRDLKPENVMLVPDPEAAGGERVKLLDFGIAKLAQGMDAAGVRTQISAVVGTPAYMSPEQCRGASLVDDRADVYSLGVVLYELLVGRRPFLGSSAGELMGQHLFLEPPRVDTAESDVPAVLISLVATLLRKDRELRPRMAQVVEQLEKLGEPYGLSGRRSGLVLRAPLTAQTVLTSAPTPEPEIISLHSGDLLSLPALPATRVAPVGIRRGPRARQARIALAALGLFGVFVIGLYSRLHDRLVIHPQAMVRPILPTVPDIESRTWRVTPLPLPVRATPDSQQSNAGLATVNATVPTPPAAPQSVPHPQRNKAPRAARINIASASAPLSQAPASHRTAAKPKVTTSEVLED